MHKLCWACLLSLFEQASWAELLRQGGWSDQKIKKGTFDKLEKLSFWQSPVKICDVVGTPTQQSCIHRQYFEVWSLRKLHKGYCKRVIKKSLGGSWLKNALPFWHILDIVGSSKWEQGSDVFTASFISLVHVSASHKNVLFLSKYNSVISSSLAKHRLLTY